MNSFLGNIGNMLFNSTKANSTIPTNNSQQIPSISILLQAANAAKSGEVPENFMQNLSKTYPKLKEYDLSNLWETAQQICKERGVDIQSAINNIDNLVSLIMPSTR